MHMLFKRPRRNANLRRVRTAARTAAAVIKWTVTTTFRVAGAAVRASWWLGTLAIARMRQVDCAQASTPKYKSAQEATVAATLARMFPGREFRSVRPAWMRNPDTGAPLELDFYCEPLRLAVEVQGRQHYEEVAWFHRTPTAFADQLARDAAKPPACARRGITLVCIPYSVTSSRDIERMIRTALAAR